MADAFLQSPIRFILDQLQAYVFGSYPLLSIYLIILGLIACVSNGFDKNTTIYVMLPLIISLTIANWIPQIMWIVTLLFSAILWIMIFLNMGNMRSG